jgi:hypothetical protein
MPGSAAASASASATPTAPAPALVPLLDDAKGRSAVAEYKAILKQACGKGADRRKALASIGLEVEDAEFVCVDPNNAGKALASGALVEAGADEVLVQGRSGRSWAGGDSTLALMRSDGTSYKLVKHLFHGKGWRPLARVATPGGRDALMLCEEGGHMGLYTGTCGFLGEGSFRRDAAGNNGPGAEKNEIETVDVTTCGPGASVSLGKIELRGDRLVAPLFVDEFVLEPKTPDETAYCSRKVKKDRKPFTIEYRHDGKSFRRTTAIPRAAKEILGRY